MTGSVWNRPCLRKRVCVCGSNMRLLGEQQSGDDDAVNESYINMLGSAHINMITG